MLNMKKIISKKKLGAVAPMKNISQGDISRIKAKKIKIVEEEIEEQINEVLAPEPEAVVNEQREFREGDVLEDTSSGKRFHFHNQSVVIAEPSRFKIVE
jgi:hypothetical protein